MSLPMEVESEYAEDLSVSSGNRHILHANDMEYQREEEPEDLSK